MAKKLTRQIFPHILEDLSDKMVLLCGPRQCGKTTLAYKVMDVRGGKYYSWDYKEDRTLLKKYELDPDAPVWIFDEIHKMRSWRNWLKGVYDKTHHKHQIIVTGSAKLNYYNFGGDSLQGRYFLHRLHPLTLAEVANKTFKLEDLEHFSFPSQASAAKKDLLDLLQFGGFPEPFFKQSARFSSRWRLSYGQRLIEDDLRTLESVKDLAKIETLYDQLPRTVGSMLSLNSLREDLEVAFVTVKNWVQILERIYSVFTILPFGGAIIKAVKKEKKLYCWDVTRPVSRAAQWENLVALHLLRLVDWMETIEGRKWELRYFRDRDGHEVDFVVVEGKKPLFCVEVKESDVGIDPNLKYFVERTPMKAAFQISLNGEKDFEVAIGTTPVRVMPGEKFLRILP